MPPVSSIVSRRQQCSKPVQPHRRTRHGSGVKEDPGTEGNFRRDSDKSAESPWGKPQCSAGEGHRGRSCCQRPSVQESPVATSSSCLCCPGRGNPALPRARLHLPSTRPLPAGPRGAEQSQHEPRKAQERLEDIAEVRPLLGGAPLLGACRQQPGTACAWSQGRAVPSRVCAHQKAAGS